MKNLKNIGFICWKNQIENFDFKKPSDLLRTIELNLSNVCLLKCSFCPHGKGWKNEAPDFMTLDIIDEIYKQLDTISFNGYICLAGHGEPTLNPYLIQILEKLSKFNLNLITNGLTNVDWKKIDKFANIKISMHDEKFFPRILQSLKGTRYQLRNHTEDSQDLFKNNRAGFFNDSNDKLKDKKCFYPFYEVFIDSDGYYRLCASLWINRFNYSIFDVDILKHFIEKMQSVKKIMAEKNRSSIDECKLCNSLGTIIGENIFNIWQDNFSN